jgi:hypothetical protein
MHETDRRLETRYTAGLDSRLGFVPARVLDLGFGGALVETHEWLSLGQRSTLRLTEPSVQISAFVVRCRLVRIDVGSGRPVYEAGLRFDDSPSVRQQLAAAVMMLARQTVEVAVATCS